MFIRSLLQFLLRGPRSLGSPIARWAATLLAIGGAAFMVWSAVIHLMLYSDGYRSIPTIGPLFLAQSVGLIVVALVVVAFRRLALLAAGAIALIATAVGLLLTVYVGLFNYRESLSVPYATLSLYVEFVGAGVLLIGTAVLALAAPVRVPGNPSRARART